MTFDRNLPFKVVDGVEINLTAEEIAEHEAFQAQCAAERAATDEQQG